LSKKLQADVVAYNSHKEKEGGQEDGSGWTAIHADVFRPPVSCLLYCVFMGEGVQLGLTMLIAFVLSAIGYLSPARPGSLVNNMIFT
jgi:transmembrane 9 superfamily protein 2/4